MMRAVLLRAGSAAVVALLAACPVALATTKVVFAGLPPGSNTPAALNYNGFFQRHVKVNVGDSIRWVFSARVIHTVTFPAQGGSPPPYEVSDPGLPYSAFKDAFGHPFWFDGQPSLEAQGALPARARRTAARPFAAQGCRSWPESRTPTRCGSPERGRFVTSAWFIPA